MCPHTAIYVSSYYYTCVLICQVLHVLGLNQTDLDLETKDPEQPVFVLKRRDFGDRDYSDLRFLDV